jgi:hypothetical protein
MPVRRYYVVVNFVSGAIVASYVDDPTIPAGVDARGQAEQRARLATGHGGHDTHTVREEYRFEPQ